MGSLAALSTVQLLFVGCTIQACPVCVAWALAALAEFKQLQCVLVKVRHKCVAGRDTPNCRPGDLPRSSMAPVFRDYFFLSLFFSPRLKQNSTYAVRVKAAIESHRFFVWECTFFTSVGRKAARTQMLMVTSPCWT